ncbi:hypothetical protein CNMCM8980_005309 [Aspergillus fumigatiaffinis]|nr:hypothetical protein CNMCM8980_005309 [Aspergillus fumigatiaffinis]
MTVISRYDQACFETTRRLLAEIVNEGLATATVTSIDSARQLVITSNYEHVQKNPERCVKINLLQGAYIGLKDSKLVSLVRPENLTPPLMYHRLCYAQAPLDPHRPEDLPGMLTPSLAFVSVPRTDMRISGSFEETLAPLLTRLGVPTASEDRIIVPCLANQLPAVQLYFPNAVLVKTVSQCVDAQASMRTLTVRPELDFPYHLKVSLACYITSALRTITPWTTVNGPVFTELLERFLPPDLWDFREVASVTGSQSDFDKAKHLSCILRHDLEARARMNKETLILAAALSHHSPDTCRPYAETLFNLQTSREKECWFRRYIACLFKLALPPLLNHGIGLELHGQNLIARVCLQTGDIKGFAVRDFGGIRLHIPTLQQYGVKLGSLLLGSATMTDDLHNVWSKVHHSMLQNHVGSLMTALGLESKGGWSVVREELVAILRPDESATGQSLYQFFLGDTMPFKCFLRMRMEGKYRDYVERELPNVVLTGLPRWEDVLTDYQPLLHRT